ncbi:MAG: TetR/AcrR family transcriptional regulator [Oscillospiraceae bacterium]
MKKANIFRQGCLKCKILPGNSKRKSRKQPFPLKRDGYNNVTVNDICKACGISRSVFYSSFNGKRSILEYMVEKPQHNDDKSFMKFAHADNDFERIWQLFDRFITIAYDFGPELTSTLFIMQFESPEGIRTAIHALDDLFATLANNCAKAGIIDTEEPPDLLSRIATDLVCHELYASGAVKRATSRCAHVRGSMPRSPTTKPEYRMPAEQRDAL